MKAKRTAFQIRSDAAKQRWVRDPKKEAFWRKHIDAWRTSGLSKRAYCSRHNLSESSFSAWYREIGIRDREKITAAKNILREPKSPAQSSPAFVPLRLLPDGAGCESSKPAKLQQSDSPPIDVVIPGGAVVRVAQNSNLRLIADLVSILTEETAKC